MADRALLITLGVRDADRAAAELRKFGDAGETELGRVEMGSDTATRALNGIERAFDLAGLSAGRFGRSAALALAWVGGTAAATAASIALLTGGFLTLSREVGLVSDKLALAQASLETLGGTAASFRSLIDLSIELGASLEVVSETGNKFQLVANDIGLTADQTVTLTEAVLKLGRIGGASTQQLSAGATQLAQALASGVLQGDELRSVLENLPLVARQIAEGLGVSVGELRELGSQGALTAEIVSRALLGGVEGVRDAFAGLPRTIEQNEQAIATAWSGVVAALDERLQVSAAYRFITEELVDGLRSAERILRSDRNLTGAEARERSAGLEAEAARLRDELAAELAKRDGATNNRAEAGAIRRIQSIRAELAEVQAALDAIGVYRREVLGEGDNATLFLPAKVLEAEAAAMEKLRKRAKALADELDPLAKARADQAEKLKELERVRAGIDDEAYLELKKQINEEYEKEADRILGTTKAREAERRELDRLVDEYNKLVDGVDKSARAARAYEDATDLVHRAVEAGLVDADEYVRIMGLLRERYDEATKSQADFTNGLARTSAGLAEAAKQGAAGRVFAGEAASLVRGAISGGGVDFGGLVSTIGDRVSSRILDDLLEGDNGLLSGNFNPSSIFSNLTRGPSDFLARLSRGLGLIDAAPLTGGLAAAAAAPGAFFAGGVAPAGLTGAAQLAALGPGGGIGALAGIPTASTGGAVGAIGLGGAAPAASLAAVAPFLTVAAIALPLILGLFRNKSSGPAASSTFDIGADGTLSGGVIGTDNDGDPEIGGKLQQAVLALFNPILDIIGGRLPTGFFDGAEIGFVNGQFRANVRPGGLSPEGDQAPGDLLSFGDNSGAAVVGFVAAGLRRALREGALDISERTAEAFEVGLDRVLDGLSADASEKDIERATGDLAFLAGLDDFITNVEEFGDALAQQTRAIREAIADQVDAEIEVIREFRERAKRLLAPLDGAGDEGIVAFGGLSTEDQFADADGTSGFTLVASQVDDARAGFRFGAGVEGVYRRNPAELDPASIVDRVRLNPDTGTGAPDQEFFVLEQGATTGEELGAGFQGIRVGGIVLSRGRDEGGKNTFFNEAGDKIEAYERNGPGQRTDLVFDSAELAAFIEQSGGSLAGDGAAGASQSSEAYDKASEAIRDYARQLVDQVAGIDQASEAMTGFELALFTGEEKIRALEPALIEAGLSAEEAATTISDGVDRLRDNLREGFDDSIQRQILAVTSPSALAVAEWAEKVEGLIEQMEAVGGDTDQVAELIRVQADALLGEAEARRTSIAELQASISSTEAFANSLADLRSSLRFGSSSVLLGGPEKLAGLEAEFSTAVDLARGGDAGARADVQRLANAIFALAPQVYASGPEAQRLQSSTLAALEGLEVEARDELAVAEASLSVLEAIEANTRPSGSTTRDFGANPTRNRILADLFPEFTGAFGRDDDGDGVGNFQQFLAGLGSNDFRASLVPTLVSTIGYADGGDHAGGLRIVGERGMEIEATGASRILSNDQVAAMLRSGAASTGDGAAARAMEAAASAIVAVGADLRAVLRQVTEIMVASRDPAFRGAFGR